MSIVLLALLAQPAVPTEVRLEDACEGACPAYGPKGDWSEVRDRLLTSPTCAPKGSANDRRRGCAIRLGCAEYRFASPWELCRGVTVRGCGEGAMQGGTTLTFANGEDGFRTWYSVKEGHGRCPKDPDEHVTAGFVLLADLYMRGELDRAGHEHVTSTAILARTPVRVQRVSVQGFGHALHVRAAHPDGNANGWSVQDLTAVGLGGWGVYVEGADANNGWAAGLRVAGACRRAGAWDGDGAPTCWGIRDRSAYGSTFVAPHVAYLWDVDEFREDPNAQHPAYVMGESKTSVPVVVNPYEELGGRPSILLGNTMMIGGTQRPRTPGTAHWRGRSMGGALFVVGRGKNTGRVMLGDTGPNTALAVEVHDDRRSNARLMFDAATRTWVWRAGGSGAGDLGVTGYDDRDGAREPGRAWIGRSGDHYEGAPRSTIRRFSGPGDAPPPCDDGVPVGSTYRNTRPKIGDVLERVCVCSDGEAPRADGRCSGDKRWLPISRVDG